MCHNIGLPPISTIGFGFNSVSSDNLVPSPPANITTFIFNPYYLLIIFSINKLVTPNSFILSFASVNVNSAFGLKFP